MCLCDELSRSSSDASLLNLTRRRPLRSARSRRLEGCARALAARDDGERRRVSRDSRGGGAPGDARARLGSFARDASRVLGGRALRAPMLRVRRRLHARHAEASLSLVRTGFLRAVFEPNAPARGPPRGRARARVRPLRPRQTRAEGGRPRARARRRGGSRLQRARGARTRTDARARAAHPDREPPGTRRRSTRRRQRRRQRRRRRGRRGCRRRGRG